MMIVNHSKEKAFLGDLNGWMLYLANSMVDWFPDKDRRFKKLMACTEEEDKIHKKEIRYKETKRIAKKAVAEGEKYIFKLAKVRSRQKDLGTVKFIKDEGGRVLLRQEDIKTRWHQYFSQLLNETKGLKEEIRQTLVIQRTQDHRSIIDITTREVGESLKKKEGSKAFGHNNILIEVWRGLGDEGIHWLTNLLNVILRSREMPEEWRVSTLIPLFKNKGDALVCGNYKGIKLLSHTMKTVGKSD
ncbi:uncharacterized protein LOC130803164 [Amaranthus tricolor]|uniref:uncharacterized protein LOC130803164 n=1 Tax=Amaranthus tricolor TaxID=29722 RepID=UPI0025835B35|nr:uncharacterized protein LOC130803164 [Amaranthus tricolor]